MKFEWDDTKAVSNFGKHDVSFQEASTVFGDPLAGTFPDPDHSQGEERWLTVGLSVKGRLLVVAHTEHDVTFRIISARVATTHERSSYEQ
jgi:hypothetical protein